MKIKLIDVETNTHIAELGTCELCFTYEEIDEPTYVFEVNNQTFYIPGSEWDWGDYSEVSINAIELGAFLNEHNFVDLQTDAEIKKMLFTILKVFNWYGNDPRTVAKLEEYIIPNA